MKKYTKEQIQRARDANLVEYCEENGFELKVESNGEFRLVGYNGIMIRDNMYYSFHDESGGNAVEFCLNVLEMDFLDAVEGLLEVSQVNDIEDFNGDFTESPTHSRLQREAGQEKKGVLVLPSKADNSAIYSYLVKTRRIGLKRVKGLIAQGLLYQDDHKNCVFVCKDKAGVVMGAILRGTYAESSYKGNAKGSNSNYGWVLAPTIESKWVVIVEAPIDAMSLLELYPSSVGCYVIALGGLHVGAIRMFLSEYDHVKKILLALDNDEPAREISEQVMEEFHLDYEIKVLSPVGFKDWNEALVAKKTAS